MAKVAIIGMGYVGQGMLRLFQRAHEVVWYDIETQPDREVVKGADLAVICVPTPRRDDGACDTSIVQDVCGWVDASLVLIKSTVPPGTTDWLNQNDAKKGAWGRFHFSPEYMGEPRNFVPEWKYPDPRLPYKHDFVIVGGMQAERVLDLIVPCMGPHTRFTGTDTRSAELVKYMENAYFALKVSFVTEFRNLARLLDVDWYTLRALWLLDPRVEPDHTLAFEGDPGWGGKCLPKDVSALCAFARQAEGSSPLFEALQRINDGHRGVKPKSIKEVRKVSERAAEDCQHERTTPEGLEDDRLAVLRPKPEAPQPIEVPLNPNGMQHLRIEGIDPSQMYSGAQVQQLITSLQKVIRKP